MGQGDFEKISAARHSARAVHVAKYKPNKRMAELYKL